MALISSSLGRCFVTLTFYNDTIEDKLEQWNRQTYESDSFTFIGKQKCVWPDYTLLYDE